MSTDTMPAASDARLRWIFLLVVAALFLAGAAVRLHDLERRTMGHTESYTPGIELPQDYGEPRSRVTLAGTIKNNIWEPHPPGWYVGMWGWTKLLGTELFTIRFPAVLFGAACILLVFTLGVLDDNPRSALAAAALMAFNGHQIYWSQMARPSTMVCFAGLLATILLVTLVRGAGRSRPLLFAYGAVVVWGLLLDYYFWILLAAHAVWNVICHWRSRHAALGILRTHLLIVVLASPLMTMAAFKSRAAHFAPDLFPSVRDFLELGFLFVTESPVPHAPPRAPEMALTVIGLALLGVGLAVRRKPAPPATAVEVRGPSLAMTGVAAAAMVVVIVGISKVVLGPHAPHKMPSLLATAALPVLLFGVALGVRSERAPLVRLGDALGLGRRSPSPVTVLALGPALLVMAVSPRLPLFVARHMMIFTPYLLLVMASGIAWMIARSRRLVPRAAVALLLAVLVAGHVVSIRWYHDRKQSPEDYASLARQWIPEIRPDDLVFVRDHWSTTPVFYYLPPSRYRFVWHEWSEATRRNPESRVWVLGFQGSVAEAEQEALAGYAQERVLRAFGIRAELWVPE